jgi:excisionase family DNA binding protein
MIGTTLGLHIRSSKLYAIASEIAPTEFRMLPTTRFAPSNRVRMSSMKVIWRREQLNRGGSGEQRTTTSASEARPMRMAKRESSMLRPTMEKLGLTVPEAAALSSLGQTSIYKAIREGRLRIRKYGTRTIITRADLASFLENLPDETERPER